MRDPLVLLAHLSTTLIRLLGPGGARAVIAQTLLVKQKRLIGSARRELLDQVYF